MLLIRENVERIVADDVIAKQMIEKEGYKEVPEKEKSTAVAPRFDGMDVEQLKVYASEHGIDIGQATSVNGILKKIADAEKKNK